MLDLLLLGNLIEAGIWLVMALILAGKAIFARGKVRLVLLILAVGFLSFSVSDVIEARTGSWWNPPGLLAMKGGCIAVFVLGFWEYHRLSRKQRRQPNHGKP